MSGGEDRDTGGPGSSQRLRAAALIEEHQSHILDEWLAGTYARIPAAQDKGRAELADHFTEVLDDVVTELRDMSARAPANVQDLQVTGKTSSMHGRERSVVEGYTVSQLANEYIVLRRVLTKFCGEHGICDWETLDILSRVIEIASLVSLKAFAQSMQEVQQKLAGTLVHDVRTPLGVAYTYAEIISATELPAERRVQVSRTITRSLRRAIGMLEELLDVTKLRAGQGLLMKFTQGDINKEIRTLCGEAEQIYSNRVHCELEDGPVEGVFDFGLITRTVENLVSNAAKFGYEGTPITVSLRDYGEHVSLRVHNQGDAIPRAERDNIFCFFSEPISRGDAEKKGWGLGLSLIKVVADSHGGKVIFDSRDNGGTTFGMELHKHARRDGDTQTVLI